MKFNIKDIGDQGLRVERRLGTDQVHSLLSEAGVEPAPGHAYVELDAELVRPAAAQTVFLHGRLAGEFSVACARCLGPASIHFEEPELRLTFLPPPSAEPVADERELSLEDVDTYVHDGVQIDLWPMVREQLLLAIPITPLCHEGCKGICTTCGADLNVQPCSCDQQAAKSPLAQALQQLKDKMGEEGKPS